MTMDLLQNHQHCSRPTKTSPSNFILIPDTTDHHRHHPDPPRTPQSLPESSLSTKSSTGPPTLLQVYFNQFWLLYAYRSHSRPMRPSPFTPALPCSSQSLPDHFRQLGLTLGPLALFPANHNLYWPLHNYPSHSSPSTIIPDPCQPSFQIHAEPLSLPDHFRPTGNTPGLTTQLQANSFLSEPVPLVTTLYMVADRSSNRNRQVNIWVISISGIQANSTHVFILFSIFC